MKNLIFILVFSLLMLNSALFAEEKDKVLERMDDLEKLFKEEAKEDLEIKKSQQEMLKELDELMRSASDNMKVISPMLKNKKTGNKVQGIEDETLKKLAGMVKLLIKLEQKEDPAGPPPPNGRIQRKKLPGLQVPSQNREGDKPAQSDEMSSGTVKEETQGTMKPRNPGEQAFKSLPPKEREAYQSSLGSKTNSSYAKQLRQYFDMKK